MGHQVFTCKELKNQNLSLWLSVPSKTLSQGLDKFREGSRRCFSFWTGKVFEHGAAQRGGDFELDPFPRTVSVA